MWAGDLDCYPIADAFASYVARTPLAFTKAEAWSQSNEEWVGSAGWLLVAYLSRNKMLADSYFEQRLEVIRRDIKKAKNRVRHNMNNALIGISLRSAALQREAVAVARAIGKVEVDHGQTACTTPDAEAYILKARAHKK